MSHPRSLAIAGQRFGRLLVLERVTNNKYNQSVWRCRCDCGAEKDIAGRCLIRGQSTSCGCLARELVIARSTTHGQSKGKNGIYSIWHGMRRRCNNPRDPGYPHYGGRGIKICARWDDFLMFQQDMLPTYAPGLTLERKDVNKGYDPDNCCWIPGIHQSRNRCNTHWIDLNGERVCLAEAARRYRVDPGTLAHRINHLKWDPMRALTTPIRPMLPKGQGKKHTPVVNKFGFRGVGFNERHKTYFACGMVNGRRLKVEGFTTPEEAHQVYTKLKETATMLTPVDGSFKKAFGTLVSDEPTFRGKHWQWPGLDKGEWAPKALLIIYHESGLPDEFQCPALKKNWDKLEAELSQLFGVPVFIESQNPAVSAVWPV